MFASNRSWLRAGSLAAALSVVAVDDALAFQRTIGGGTPYSGAPAGIATRSPSQARVVGPAPGGGLTTPCTGPSRNRNQCGSLLLFPELDNTEGKKTLFTITDACTTGIGPTRQVEIVYINRLTCLETNTVIDLTPADTFTFVTKDLLAQSQVGFAYAFARQTSLLPIDGVPIVYNHLIGEETILNGIQAFQYTVSAVSFRGIGEEGAPNDDDGDGIRDLNGPGANAEYEEAPDQIVIPRFLGQDPGNFAPAVFDSDLILIALSGGVQFNTLVLFHVYNEKGLLITSQERDFRCWDKRKLRDWVPGTLNDQLDNLMDPNDSDPNEPLGLEPARQAGWLWIDGVTADSGFESIADPAIYALLIERSNNGVAASLPFELCSQTNGDLVVLGSGGDTPAADGQ